MISKDMSKPISRAEQSKSYSPAISARKGNSNEQSFESLLKPAESNSRDSKPVSREEQKPKPTTNHQSKTAVANSHPHTVTVHTHPAKESTNEPAEKKNETKPKAVGDAPTNDNGDGVDWSAKQTGLSPEELAKAVEEALDNIAGGDNNLGANGKSSPGTNRMIRPTDIAVSDDTQPAPGDPLSPEGVYDILSVEMITANNPNPGAITGLTTGHADFSPLIFNINQDQKISTSTETNSLKANDKIETVASNAQSISLGDVKTQTDGAGGFDQSKGEQNNGSLGTLTSKIELQNDQHAKSEIKENSFVVAQEAAMTAASKPTATTSPQTQTVSGPQLIDQIVSHVKPAMTELRMVLRPDDLGTLNLKVSTQNGRIVASILASSDSVKHALEQHLPQLHAALTEQGLKVSSVSVDTQTSQFSQSFMSDGNQSNGQNATQAKPGFNNSRVESKAESVTSPISRTSVSSINSLNILA